ncbi:MAG: hypothetical protein ABIH71_00180 [Candidatus Omnitrophota bacterium]|nr:hypothetical protein [Candidatus Omnitrophota bacterium]
MHVHEDKIKVKVEEILKPRGIDLVEFSIFSTRRSSIVRCLIDYPQGGIIIDECVKINKEVTFFLDESNLLGENYSVEVNSPGLERKLKTYKDFLRVKNRIVSLWFISPFEGKEYFEGELVDLNEECLYIKNKNDIYKISLKQVKVGKEKIT